MPCTCIPRTTTSYPLSHEAGNPVYTYDAHGNMTTMPHLTAITWNYADLLRNASNGTFTSCYVYNAGGGRTRKVVVKGNIREERLYLGNYELYRKYENNTLDTERQTLHIADDQHRFALIDRLTVNNGATLTTPTVAVRYQYDNHLGSASLELDQNAAIISYEEYHPFGTTSYRSGRTETEVALKRYKYVGKERDEETGLYYYGARYYAAWIARFVSVDPLQLKYPHYTPYQYAGNKPVSYIDLDGLEEANTTEEKKPEERQSESITPMQSKNADLLEVPMEEGDFSLRKIPELSFNNFIITGEGSKLFIDILSDLTGLGLNIEEGISRITSENNNTDYISNVLKTLVKDIISGKTEPVTIDVVMSSDEIFIDQFPFNNPDNSTDLFAGKKINDNKVDLSDIQSIPYTELKAALIGHFLSERAIASQGWNAAHQNGLQIEGDIMREVYPLATNRITAVERKLENKPMSLDPNDKRTVGGYFHYTVVEFVSFFTWEGNSAKDINRINKVSGFFKLN